MKRFSAEKKKRPDAKNITFVYGKRSTEKRDSNKNRIIPTHRFAKKQKRTWSGTTTATTTWYYCRQERTTSSVRQTKKGKKTRRKKDHQQPTDSTVKDLPGIHLSYHS